MTENLANQLEQYLPAEYLNMIGVAGELAHELGLEIYLVGGAVRDILLGKSSLDVDLVVEGDAPLLASQLARIIGDEIVVHRRFGTAKLRHKKTSIDFITARTETYAYPGALPTVRPGSIEDDLFRRDFTINAMAIHLNLNNYGKLVDPCKGVDDLKNRLIRILHEKSFADDATRILRAIRYEQRFDFQLEPFTERLLHQNLSMLSSISGDRTRHELEHMLKEEYPEKMLLRASALGVLQKIYPALKGDVWLEGKFNQARFINRSPSIALYFSLLIYHLTHEEVEDLIGCLNIPKTVALIIRDTLRIKEILPSLADPKLSPSVIYRLLECYHQLSIQANAIASDSELLRQRLYLYLDKLRYIKTSLNGVELQKMGVSPGIRLGEILREMHDAKLNQVVKTREEEEELVHRLLLEGE